MLWIQNSQYTVICQDTQLKGEGQSPLSSVWLHRSLTLSSLIITRRLFTCMSLLAPLKGTLRPDTQRRAISTHISPQTSHSTLAKWTVLKCQLRDSSPLKTTPHWTHCINSLSQASLSHSSNPTYLHSPSQHPITFSSAEMTPPSLSLPTSCPHLWLGPSKCDLYPYIM